VIPVSKVTGSNFGAKPEKANSISMNPSFYYIKNMEIMSMKEFVYLMQESKKKQEREERVKSRGR